MKFHFFSVFSFITLAHVVIIIGVSLRVIKVRPPVAADRGQKSEIRGQMAAEREQRSEGRAHSAWGTGFRNEASLFLCIQFYDSWLRELPQEIRSDLQRLSQQARSLGRLAETTVHIPHCAATGSSCSMRPNRFLVL